jgi:putative transposase
VKKILNEYYKSIYNDEFISSSQERKSNISHDFIHKLSKCLIEECLDKEIKVIVVGKNKGWKNEINNGKVNNRAMYNFPHAKFIEILKYKALLKDIVVIEIEESYTSKTSFIDNEELRVFNHSKENLIKGEEKNLTQGDKSQLSKGKKKLVGKRINQKFISKNKKVIHADVNGSFNIVRKVLLNFSYNKKLINIEYELMEISNYRKRKLFNFYKTKEINKVKNENLTLNEHCG